MNVKLGKKRATFRPSTRLLARYLDVAKLLPAMPPALEWDKTTTAWQMLDNDTVGDCTCACAGHIIMEDEIANGRPITVTAADVLKAYEAVGGYVPGNPNTDNGAEIQDVLNYWKKTGICGNTIIDFVGIEPRNIVQQKAAIYLFGNIDVGIQLPITAQSQTQNGRPWALTPGYQNDPNAQPGSWGGHCLAPGTRVLTESLKWIPIEKLEPGDFLVGFDEFPSSFMQRRSYRRSIVEASQIIELPSYDLEFEDGTSIRASADHLWLVDSGGEKKWLKTEDMRVEGVGGRGTKVCKAMNVWEEDRSWTAGYLAGAFDGEGWLSTGGSHRGIHKIGFSQRRNRMLEMVKSGLDEIGIAYRESSDESGFAPGKSIQQLAISGRTNLLRFLGSMRPRRLLEKFSADKIGCLQTDGVALVKKKFVGTADVVALQTSTRTYIAEGFSSHNCVPIFGYDESYLYCVTWGAWQAISIPWFKYYCDEAYGVLDQDWIGQSVAPNGFSLALLEQDLAIV
jgi:hypothetical protein